MRFSYRKTDVLKDINFQVNPGTLSAILGANGAGKSTLIKCINGILKPKKGQVFFGDLDLLAMKQKEKAKLIGYVPQSTYIEDSGLSVFDLVLTGRVPRMKGRMRSEDFDIANQVLKQMSLEKYADKLLSQLSGGERQRVLIARALAQEPVIMLLDEPTSNLDLRFQIETMEIIKALSIEKDLTVMAVIHDLNTVITYADQALLLKSGQIYASGHPDHVIDMERVEKIYDIRVNFSSWQEKEFVIPQRN